MNPRVAGVARAVTILVVALVALVLGWRLFVVLPADLAELAGVVLAIGLVVGAVRAAGSAAGAWFPTHNVAEVSVHGPITRDGGRPGPITAPVGTGADAIVEQLERADADRGAQALLVDLNTPGGEVVPSDDIRRAVEAFDGPTVAYASDVCASGGYWIAAGCDELWAHEAGLVGSIGVIGSRPNVTELADDLGISYERFVAGAYKDAGLPLKEVTPDERAYLQGIIDDFYDEFVERVAEGRGLDPDAIRETEAKVYLGGEAAEIGLVDSVGTREDVEARLEELVGTEARIQEFSPERGLAARLRGGAESAAFALGAGVASRVAPDDGFDFRL